jgi:hypothetical protein
MRSPRRAALLMSAHSSAAFGRSRYAYGCTR